MSDYNPINPQTGLPNLPIQYQVPLNSLFTSVFGLADLHILRHFKVTDGKDHGHPAGPYSVGNVPAQESSDYCSPLGTPVQFWMQFNSRAYRKRQIDGTVKFVNLPDTILPFSSVAGFSRSKRYTETPMVGQKGSVIEEYGFEPWEIRIQGFVIDNEVEGTVKEQMARLARYENLNDGISVAGEMFERLDIDSIAFSTIDYQLSRTLNGIKVIPFEIKARSVETMELIQYI